MSIDTNKEQYVDRRPRPAYLALRPGGVELVLAPESAGRGGGGAGQVGTGVVVHLYRTLQSREQHSICGTDQSVERSQSGGCHVFQLVIQGAEGGGGGRAAGHIPLLHHCLGSVPPVGAAGRAGEAAVGRDVAPQLAQAAGVGRVVGVQAGHGRGSATQAPGPGTCSERNA